MTELDLLKKYSKAQVGGVIFREVRVGKASNKPPCYGKERSIDGVRIPTSSSKPDEMKRFKGNEQEFEELLASAAAVEVIEVAHTYGSPAHSIGRGVIGQALVGKYLLEMKYPTAKATPIVVCMGGKGRDCMLEKVCERIGVKVWSTRGGFIDSIAA